MADDHTNIGGDKITVRDACRRRMPLDGADAQALEHGMTQLEQENASLALRGDRLLALLARCVKYAREDRMQTLGVTRLDRALAEAEKLLAASPGERPVDADLSKIRAWLRMMHEHAATVRWQDEVHWLARELDVDVERIAHWASPDERPYTETVAPNWPKARWNWDKMCAEFEPAPGERVPGGPPESVPVTNCCDCPLVNMSDVGETCRHPKAPLTVNGRPKHMSDEEMETRPQWCPLSTGSALVHLRAAAPAVSPPLGIAPLCRFNPPHGCASCTFLHRPGGEPAKWMKCEAVSPPPPVCPECGGFMAACEWTCHGYLTSEPGTVAPAVSPPLDALVAIAKERLWIRDLLLAEHLRQKTGPSTAETWKRGYLSLAERIASGNYPRPLVVDPQPKNAQEKTDADQ